jgi:hypothetical protein
MEGLAILLKTIKVLQKEIFLPCEFKSNGSSIQNKTTYFYLDVDTQRIIEIPYSPSMGLLREELVSLHPFVVKNLSWLWSDLKQLDLPQDSIKHNIVTYGIGADPIWNENTLVKIKCDALNSLELARQTHQFPRSGQGWIVDFNQGLDEEQLSAFIQNSFLGYCFGIEQPMPIGRMPKSFYEAAPIILDEEMSLISFSDLDEVRPRAVVMKPWRYHFLDYLEWHRFLIDRRIPYMVGSMIQSEVANQLCDDLNKKASIQYESEFAPLSMNQVLSGAKFLGEILMAVD